MSRRKLYLSALLIASILMAYGLLAGGQKTLAQATSTTASSLVKISKPEVSRAVKFDVSPPLSDMVAQQGSKPQTGPFREIPEGAGLPLPPMQHNSLNADNSIQKFFGPGAPAIPSPIVSFNGISNSAGVAPPDPNGDVNANYYVQMVNLSYQVFDKTGASLLGPFATNTLFAGFGGPCQTENAGDPVVLHDQLADRWVLTQFTDPTGPFYNCVAVSQTSDPRGAYYRYAFVAPAFPDYPKYGVWPDAYYLNTRESGNGVLGAYALERQQMIIGNPAAQVVRFQVAEAYPAGNGLLPSDMDGSTLPPAGSPNFFVGTQDDGGGLGAPFDAINIYKFHVDFTTPANSTFTGPVTLPVDPFISTPSFCAGRACVPQPGTTNKIDMLSYRQRPTFRLAYRNFGDHESLVTNQSVEAPVGMAGIRWYELRDPNGTPVVYQQGTYSPGASDGIFRWMGSIAMDASGNMALGYSASSSTLFPSVRYTGRLSTDPLGTMPQGEGSIVEGTGSQTAGGNRWGDYSSMNVDPSDDCTFWFTSEYVPTTSASGWRGRAGAFKFPNCVQGGGTATPTVTGTPPTATRTPTLAPSSTATNTVPVPTATQTVCATSYQITTSTGTIVPGTVNSGSACDDCDTSITIPFAYSLYGQSFTSVNASSNGKAEFQTVNEPGGYSNSCLPAAANLGPYDYTIFPYWDDQRTDSSTCTGGCGIFTSVTGSAPNRIFNIEWRTIYFSGTGTANYELRLYEGQNRFDIVYGTVAQGNTSATSGVQRSSTNATQYFCNGSGGAPTGVVTYTQTSCGSPVPTGTATSIIPTLTATSTRTNTAAPTSTTVPSSTAVSSSTVGATSTVAASSTSTVAPSATSVTGTITVEPTSTVCPISFTDVPPNSTFYTFIRCLACRGVISGYSDGTFRPGNDITRGQIAKMVSNAAGFSEDPGPQIYEDVNTNNPFFIWINRLSNRGFMGGYPCGTIPTEPCINPDNRPYFRPFANATRGQLAKIVANTAGVGGTPTGLYYTDVPEDNPFYLWIMRLTNIGVMSGYPCGGPGEPCDDQNRPYFRPFANVTRGQASKIVANTFFPNCQTPQR